MQWRLEIWQIFQSTLLMRGATDIDAPCIVVIKISIHAPHARSDNLCIVD